MELIHKQEELEQLELEQALAISLAIEEERLRRQLEQEADFENEAYYDRKGDDTRAQVCYSIYLLYETCVYHYCI